MTHNCNKVVGSPTGNFWSSFCLLVSFVCGVANKMGKTCAVVSCSNDQSIATISLFKFQKRDAWLRFLKLANGDHPWENVPGMFICSSHFHQDFIREGTDRLKIVKNGYPSLLNGENIMENANETAEFVVEESGSSAVAVSGEDVGCDCGASKVAEEQKLIIENLRAELEETKKNLADVSKQLEIKRNLCRTLSQKDKRNEQRKLKRKREDDEEHNVKKNKLVTAPSSTDENDKQQQLLEELMMRTGAIANSPFSYMLREFSFQLHYYSPRAYNYVRSQLPCLPHPLTLSTWTNAIRSKPGFLPNSIEFLKKEIEESKNTIYYAVSCDEVYVRKHIIHDGDGFVGFTDYGDITENEEPDKKAKTAVFLMATAINSKHRVPVGYVLTNGLTADVFAKIIKRVLEKLNEINCRVVSVTFDGLGVNLRAVSKLGANLDVESQDFRPYISHPSTGEKVHVILDPSHMMKLLRNLWNHFKILIDSNGNEIRWGYITELQKLQEKCGLRAANKLTKRHVRFHQQKMKTNLCVQTLSNSVSIALGVCNELGVPGFAESKPTEEFLSLTDRLFDSLNSKSRGTGYKAPINASNLQMHRKLFEEAKKYLASLKVFINGQPKLLLHTGRKTAIVGLIVTLTSVQALMEEIIANDAEHLKFLPTYKLSQDLLEMFFSVLRSRFGYNNNPNVKQLQQALKGMLCMNTQCINTGNCREQEETTTKVSPLRTLNSICYDDMTVDVEEHDGSNEDEEVEMYVPSKEETDFINNIVAYISGYVVRKICSKSSCSKCICKLMADEEDVPKIADECILLLKRDNGGLICPSHIVISICKLTEAAVRKAKVKGVRLMKKKNLIDEVFTNFQQNSELMERLRCSSCSIGISHANSLVRQIASIYLTARLHHLAKESSLELCPVTVRSTCVNIVQFKGQ